MRKTKIVCTIGPATKDKRMLEEMVCCGMNVARLNFSHGSHEYHKETIDMLKEIRERLETPLAILLDTKGPEVRVRSFKDGAAELVTGSEFTLTTREVEGDSTCASVTYEAFPQNLTVGDTVLVDDGSIRLRVKALTDTDILCTVEHGGTVKNNKGINVPNVHLNMPHLSEQDKKDLCFGVEQGVDFVAASFIRSKEDVIAIRKHLNYYGGHSIKIISKIENLEGIDNFAEILEHSDGIMVARGDMGVEVEFEKLPGIQKRFIKQCYRAGKMVVTATQMLESMTQNPNPTRAEITDVANAVFDGTSAVMLSGETAAGKYPLEAIRTMAKIAEQAEKDSLELRDNADEHYVIDFSDVTNAVCDAACRAARDIDAKAILALTKNGRTARSMSKFRPEQPIIAATPETATYHQLALSWGVYPVLALKQDTAEQLMLHAIDCAEKIDAVSDGDQVVIAAGVPLDTPGNTNMLKVETVGHTTIGR